MTESGYNGGEYVCHIHLYKEQDTMTDAVILSGVRTPIGAFLGSLSSLTAPQLGACAIREAVKRAGIEPGDVDEVILGCVLTGAMGQAPARQAALYGGLPNSIPCMTINKVCGSGMKAIMLAAQSIRLNESRIVVAGGMESMSNAPYVMDKARTGLRMGHGIVLDTMIHDGLWDPYNNVHMGNCGDLCAREFNYTRAQVDEYAAESYRRALAAQKEGRFKAEILPVAVPQRKGEPKLMDQDEEPGKGNPEKLVALRPAFSKEGVTTAGNASSIADGAAALVLASQAEAEKRRLEPLGRVVASATYAQDPQWCGAKTAVHGQSTRGGCGSIRSERGLRRRGDGHRRQGGNSPGKTERQRGSRLDRPPDRDDGSASCYYGTA